MKQGIDLTMSGAEMAMLVAAVGLLGDWPFESEEARSMIATGTREQAEVLAARLFRLWKEHLANAGLWDDPSGKWTRDLIERRALETVLVSLPDADASLALVSLKASITEFRENWGEFCVVGTGALHWYPVGPADLERLANRLEKSV